MFFLKKDHRPYFVKKLYLDFQEFYVKHFLEPQFESLGTGFTFIKPWNVEIFGSPILLGDHANVIATSDKKIRLTIWSDSDEKGAIKIGNCCLLCPGVRISSAEEIVVGDNCMIANGTYITDSDWHGIYNRVVPIGNTGKVTLEENVWVGDSSIICKGVTISKNSIIGAGSVVVNDIPPNSIAVGNPAVVVKKLDEEKEFTTRSHWYADPKALSKEIDMIDRDMLKNNTLLEWIKTLIIPKKGN